MRRRTMTSSYIPRRTAHRGIPLRSHKACTMRRDERRRMKLGQRWITRSRASPPNIISIIHPQPRCQHQPHHQTDQTLQLQHSTTEPESEAQLPPPSHPKPQQRQPQPLTSRTRHQHQHQHQLPQTPPRPKPPNPPSRSPAPSKIRSQPPSSLWPRS